MKYFFLYSLLSASILLVEIPPLFAQECDFPYQTSKIDYVYVAAGAVIHGGSQLWKKSLGTPLLSDFNNLDASTINSFDRAATHKKNTTFVNVSSVGKYGLFVAPAAMMWPWIKKREKKNWRTYAIMMFETALLNMSITDASKVISQRVRPYMYNSDFTNAQKQLFIDEGEGYDSFFSGHTSVAFSSAVFLSKTYTDIYGKGTWSTVIWASSLSLATATGILRAESGSHYYTDVIAGAAVGSLIGYVIPVLHKKKDSYLSMSVLPNGCYLSYRFGQ